MALRITTDGTRTKIQFVLPDDVIDGPVSAVGTFNNWKPGAHKLTLVQQAQSRQAKDGKSGGSMLGEIEN